MYESITLIRSYYRSYYTDLVHLSGLCGTVDAGHISHLAFFAFDSVDRCILLQCLSISYGLSDKPLEWLRSFMSEPTNCESPRSAWVYATFVVPQGSVFGPLLYIIYTAGIGALY